MTYSSLYFEAQMLVLPEKVPKLNPLPPEFEAPLGMWPGQRFAVSARFPNQLKIIEIPGLSEDAPAFAGVPARLYVSDGARQYEFRFEDSAPEIGDAPVHFEEVKSKQG